MKSATANLRFQAGGYYHVFNRANGFEKLFYNEGNYHYFLRRFQYFMGDYVKVFAYCMMPNHFHFLIQIKELPDNTKQDFTDDEISTAVSNQFRKFQISYSKAVNKQINRKGSLFMQNIKRKEIADNDSLLRVVTYIHQNPVEAGYTANNSEWRHSSYSQLIGEKKSTILISKKEVLEWFGSVSNFKELHTILNIKKGDLIDRL